MATRMTDRITRDTNDPFRDPAPNEAITARFFDGFVTARKDDGKPPAEQHPFKRVYCELKVAGDAGRARPVRIATPQLIERFKNEYDQFLRGEEARKQGTPIETCPVVVPPEMVPLLQLHAIYTVEQIAALSDSSLSNLGMGARVLRQAAEDYLRGKQNNPMLEELAKLRSRVAELESKPDEPELPPADAEQPAKRRGRPPKVKVEAEA